MGISKNSNSVIPAKAGIQRFYIKMQLCPCVALHLFFAGHRPSPV